ncbi:MAG: malto-oligosyltrehalose synthase, partial [Acidobacteriota bacterium]|nr:malto-oligosyltrehalose synthase [Acidobacteriota bacterium]
VDHTQLNPELGTDAEFQNFARVLRRNSMGLLMDVVPNHMCVAGSENRWWLDLLENGPSSPYARFFDVDWRPPNPNLADKVLLPILGDQFGRALENQELKLGYRAGAFFVGYYETALPVAPRTTANVLERALADVRRALADSHPDVLELESIITSLHHLPPRTETDPARLRERRRENAVVKRRLSSLVKESREVRHSIHEALMRFNGAKNDPASFDALERLLAEQAYRLSYWRVASDEINYRRFFDINELAAVRVEERPVFKAVHEITLRLIRQGHVTGLRVDHVDGLFNPEKYLNDLQRECLAAVDRPSAADDVETELIGAGAPPFYVVVEKILGHDEGLRREWPVQGTTGYDFANLLNGVFVDTSNADAFLGLYRDFTGAGLKFRDLLYECKKLILRVAMSSELHVLARRLDRVSEQHRYSRDFTFNSLHDALGEVIACFPVYRSYIRRRHTSVGEEDRRHIAAAVRAAKRRNPAISSSIFDFIRSLLLLEDPKGLTAEQRAERRDFVMRFQQLTSPVTAKGLEDTAFYRYYPLASLNEVGGEPAVFGVSLDEFHRRNRERGRLWPHTLNATSTHDTKRGEDVRARINVLSEIPNEWRRALARWRETNRSKKIEVDGAEAPDANEEYLLYQTLVGMWPFRPLDDEARAEYVSRIQEYMNKALKEAKVNTSWISPNEEYDAAVRGFVGAILDPSNDNAFLADFAEFQKMTARAGLFNSLSQTLLKVASPGVPDTYQGAEVWNFSLVDPDNRRPVDYDALRPMLASLRDARGSADPASLADSLMREPEDPRLKLYVTQRALNFRRAHAELFASCGYAPLGARGPRADNVVAFARRSGDDECIAVAARFFTRLTDGRPERLPLGAEVWGDTALPVEPGEGAARYRDVFTGAEVSPQGSCGNVLPLAEVFAHLPVALLERV